jgi:hypothetical protein
MNFHINVTHILIVPCVWAELIEEIDRLKDDWRFHEKILGMKKSLTLTGSVHETEET